MPPRQGRSSLFVAPKPDHQDDGRGGWGPGRLGSGTWDASEMTTNDDDDGGSAGDGEWTIEGHPGEHSSPTQSGYAREQATLEGAWGIPTGA